MANCSLIKNRAELQLVSFFSVSEEFNFSRHSEAAWFDGTKRQKYVQVTIIQIVTLWTALQVS
jgi:hypothetical protein